jgi:hypothetical protein
MNILVIRDIVDLNAAGLVRVIDLIKKRGYSG